MRKIIFSFILLCSASQAGAIDLNEALVNAYNNNEELKKAREDFLHDIESFPQALSQFLPRISASITRSNSKDKIQSDLDPRAKGNERVGVTKGIELKQSIFNGGADLAGLKAAQAAFRALRGQYYNSEQDIILKSIKQYIDCYSAEQKYNISDTSVDFTKKQLESVEEKFNLGEATKSDVASAKAEYASAVAKKLQAYTNYQKNRADFIKIFGVEPNDLSLPEIPANLPVSFEQLKNRALSIHPAIESARHHVSQRKSEALAAKAQLLPKVDFSLSAQKNLYEPQKKSTDTYNKLNVTTAISASVPILAKGGAEYSAARQASNKARKAVISYDSTEKEINTNCISTWEGFIHLKSATEAAAQAVEAAEIAYEGTLQEEMVGSKTVIEALQAEVKLKDSKIQKVETDAQYILNAYQLKSLEGKLTAKNLKVAVKYFEPEQEFKKVKMKIIGF